MRAHPELYINKASSTLVALMKLLEGVVAGFFLFHFVWVLIQVIKTVIKGSAEIGDFLNSFITELGIEKTIIDVEKVNQVAEGVKFAVYIYIGIMVLISIGLALVVVDAIAAFFLRFSKAGAGIVRGIHRFYVFLCVLYLILFGFLAYMFLRNSAEITGIIGDTGILMLGLTITLVVIGVVYVAIVLLQLCYHKDIARAMTTVHHELTTGQQGDLKRTHLSGISFIFAILYAIIVGILVITVLIPNLNSKELEIIQVAAIIAVPLIMMIKHFAICCCNRNLKNSL